jgi:hypothetical protein
MPLDRDIREGLAIWIAADEEGEPRPGRPSPAEAGKIRQLFGDLIIRTINRAPIALDHFTSKRSLMWNPSAKRWQPWEELPPKASWIERASRVLGRLILDAGHLLRECPAPKGSRPCGKWFVANRPRQEYCSPKCQTRVTSRAWRKRRN